MHRECWLVQTGTTTLVKAAQSLSMKVHDEFPSTIAKDTLKAVLTEFSKLFSEEF